MPCWGTEPVFHEGTLIGQVTSGGMGWRTGQMLAAAWVDADAAAVGAQLHVQILMTDVAAHVVPDPVYDPDNTKLMS